MDDFYILETMGQVLKKQRLLQRKTQGQVVEAVKGVSFALYENIEDDFYTPSTDTAKAICDYLQIDWNKFLSKFREEFKDRAEKNKLNRGKR